MIRAERAGGAFASMRRLLGSSSNRRILAVVCVAAGWFLLVLAKLVDLQVRQHEQLSAKATRQHVGSVDIPARRGHLIDRHGRELALSMQMDSIGIFSNHVSDPPAVAAALAEAVAVDEQALRRRIERGGFQWVKRLVTLAEAQRARALGLDFLHFEEESRRYYPYGWVAAQVLGTVGIDHTGQAGLEQKFESQLRGTPGRGLMQYDALRRRYGWQVLQAPKPGSDVLLNLDLELQSLADLELERAVRETKSQSGTIVLMRPGGGEILAMASWPRFDPNGLSRTKEDLENLRNFAVSAMVEPGSTFKVLTASAALEEGLVSVEDEFDCEMGGMWIDRRRIRDHHPYGILTMPQVLMKSSNVGTIKIGYRVGAERLHDYIRRFGFGTKTGVNLPGEIHGLVRPLERWSDASLASLSMGQEIGVTAVQMASLFGTIANGGVRVKPRVVRAIRESGSQEVPLEPPSAERVISQDTAATMQVILEQVVQGGTGRFAQIQGYRVAGKTGTAQMINPVTRSFRDGMYLASFCGFAPVNNPAVVGVVMLFDPRGQFYYGGRIAAPVFSTVVRQALRILDVAPSRIPSLPVRPPADVDSLLLADFIEGRARDSEDEPIFPGRNEAGPAEWEAPTAEATSRQPESASTWTFAQEPHGESLTAPDVLGLTMREVFALGAQRGIPIEPHGSGFAQQQYPGPNEALSAGDPIKVVFGAARVELRKALDSAGEGGG
ncbi:MAG: transpeptidase family protein [Acidobacteriia bacterium]|nr:transpeptidase family protein [Terriglobia bacterium]MYG04549.1 transpeptidase family protein [Terriglobia bacterium]MYK08994.1 transpeptidase family protein [Terriglobia bacterium]